MAIGASEVIMLPILFICSAVSIWVPYRFAFIGPLIVIIFAIFVLELRRPPPKRIPGAPKGSITSPKK